MKAEKIQPKLLLVKDQGVYLMTNANFPQSPSERGTVAYAEGMNPTVDEFNDWYETARRVMGGDDMSQGLPASWYKLSESAKKRKFQLRITSKAVALKL